MKKFLLPTLLIAMFALPGVAAAKSVEVKGPLAIGGVGFLRGELTMTNAAESRPFQYLSKGGYIGFLDLKGDLKVRCQGFEETEVEITDEGKVYYCMGQRGRALARGSHFVFRAFGVQYRARLSEGTSGTLTGRFVDCTKPGEGGDEDHPRLCGNLGQGDGPQGQRGDVPQGDRNAAPGGGARGNGGQRNRGEGNGKGNGNGSGNADSLPSLAELAALLTAQK